MHEANIVISMQRTTHQLVVVIVIATTVLSPWCLQAWQQRGLPLGVVPHHSGDATRASVASGDDVVVTVGYLDTTSPTAMIYQLIEVNQQQ